MVTVCDYVLGLFEDDKLARPSRKPPQNLTMDMVRNGNFNVSARHDDDAKTNTICNFNALACVLCLTFLVLFQCQTDTPCLFSSWLIKLEPWW